MNSRMKGKNGELEFAKLLRGYGHTARRGVQFKGGVDSPDVVCDTLPGIHFEVKRVEAGNPYTWMAQAIDDAGGKTPIVAHRRSHEDWIAVMRFSDLMRLFDAAKRSAESQSPRLEVQAPRSEPSEGS